MPVSNWNILWDSFNKTLIKCYSVTCESCKNLAELAATFPLQMSALAAMLNGGNLKLLHGEDPTLALPNSARNSCVLCSCLNFELLIRLLFVFLLLWQYFIRCLSTSSYVIDHAIPKWSLFHFVVLYSFTSRNT